MLNDRASFVRRSPARTAVLLLALFAAVAVALTACASPNEKLLTTKLEPTYPLAAGTNTLDPAYVASLRALGADLLAQGAAGRNALVSPFSASMAFTMAASGAKGDTLAEMLAALRFGAMPLADIVAQNRLAFENLYRNEEGLKVLLANSVWVFDGYPFRQDFLDAAQKDFFASVRGVSTGDGTGPLALINAWASDHTNGKIPKLMEHLEPNTVMVLVNALYFQGAWETPFGTEETKSGTFTKADGTTVSTDFLWRTGEFRTIDADAATLVAVPYKGEDAMILALPKEGRSALDAADALLAADAREWSGWLSNGTRLGLPKFTFGSTMDLAVAMQALGMKKAFLADEADFSGLSDAALQDGLFISAAVQKTFIAVNEKGTEAGAATAVSISDKALPATLSFDRPFAFAIVDLQGVPLFAGLVADPTDHEGAE